MKCVRTPIEVEVVKYERNASLEDGYELYSNVVTMNNEDCNNVIQEERNGKLMCPYIATRRGRTYIKEGDYIVMEADGTKIVCGGDKVKQRYKEI